MAFHNGNNPVIALTGRHKRIDNFAFTLLHELGHVSLHLKKNQSFEPFIDNLENKQQQANSEETQANTFAKYNLIDENDWQRFTNTYRFDEDSMIKFANKIGVPSAVVRGRLCNEALLSYKAPTSIDYSIH